MRALLALIALLLPLSLPAADKPQVVTSFSILADLTRAVGGEHIALTNLVGPDEDAHVFEPSPEHARTLLQADLIIANGLGFEPWLERLLASSEARGRRIDQVGQHAHALFQVDEGQHLTVGGRRGHRIGVDVPTAAGGLPVDAVGEAVRTAAPRVVVRLATGLTTADQQPALGSGGEERGVLGIGGRHRPLAVFG